MFQSKKPFTAMRHLRRQIDKMDITSVCYFHHPDMPFMQALLMANLLAPRPFFHPSSSNASWPPFLQSAARDQIGALTEGTTGIVQGDPPFERPLKHLDCGLSLIDLRQPMVVVVVNRNTLEWDATNLGFIWLGGGHDPGSLGPSCRPGRALVRHPDRAELAGDADTARAAGGE